MRRAREFLRRLLGGEHPADELFGTGHLQARLYEELVRKVGGDRRRADRLIAYERRRMPRGNPTRWLENAIWHEEHDQE